MRKNRIFQNSGNKILSNYQVIAIELSNDPSYPLEYESAMLSYVAIDLVPKKTTFWTEMAHFHTFP